MKLNPHLHVVFLDGVYATAADSSLEFRSLPRLSTTDVADALQVARARILGYLERRNIIHIDALRVDDLSVRELGFSLHAATRAGADDEKGREALQ